VDLARLRAATDEGWTHLRNTPGYLSEREARFLMTALALAPAGGANVEIGSFKGRSTVGLGTVARILDLEPIIAIDPHTAPSTTDPALDGAASSIAALPTIVEAVGERIEVHMDGGIRCGQDVLKALALGAKGVYLGRPILYGLGAMGGAGVTQCLEIIRKELDVTMALCGITDMNGVGKNVLLPGTWKNL